MPLHLTPYTNLAHYLSSPCHTINLKSITTMKRILLFILTLTLVSSVSSVKACTGITLKTTANHPVTARTIEWSAQPLNLMYVVVSIVKRYLILLFSL